MYAKSNPEPEQIIDDFPDDEIPKLTATVVKQKKHTNKVQNVASYLMKSPLWKRKSIPEKTSSMDFDPIQAAGMYIKINGCKCFTL